MGAAALGGPALSGDTRGTAGPPPASPRTVPAHTAPHARDRGAPGADTVPEGFPPPCPAHGCGADPTPPAAVPAEKTLNSGGTNFFWFFLGGFSRGGERVLHPTAGTRSPVGSIPSPPRPEGPQRWGWQADDARAAIRGSPPCQGAIRSPPQTHWREAVRGAFAALLLFVMLGKEAETPPAVG